MGSCACPRWPRFPTRNCRLSPRTTQQLRSSSRRARPMLVTRRMGQQHSAYGGSSRCERHGSAGTARSRPQREGTCRDTIRSAHGKVPSCAAGGGRLRRDRLGRGRCRAARGCGGRTATRSARACAREGNAREVHRARNGPFGQEVGTHDLKGIKVDTEAQVGLPSTRRHDVD